MAVSNHGKHNRNHGMISDLVGNEQTIMEDLTN